ncbi:hypothetical protein SLNWT_3677 [Streptomyces albus]|uniref:Uncharacterized protein n=1 Tax=Streptomyces albus (strain ATCC 21838 / DSM 41398 / FERM P-419 / JCM 4703 / NBRC 107858) TaxID=1081613 RepID=A0A0B5EN83_STRA4|nr:hypothetical protein SLNWT_3677 [Streptomyces albus]AOU78358.1 hypothetical protein SLNHY_3667 [Streptomyces albus]AYN34108.1 hypothetical protein DUI70_3607 [Streptomyces albus]
MPRSHRQHGTAIPTPRNWLAAQAEPILPSAVAAAIRAARDAGWAPEGGSSPFELDRSEGFVPLAEVMP